MSLKVYGLYGSAGGTFVFLGVFFLFIMENGSRTLTDWWLSHWIGTQGTTWLTTADYFLIWIGIGCMRLLISLVYAPLFLCPSFLLLSLFLIVFSLTISGICCHECIQKLLFLHLHNQSFSCSSPKAFWINFESSYVVFWCDSFWSYSESFCKVIFSFFSLSLSPLTNRL